MQLKKTSCLVSVDDPHLSQLCQTCQCGTLPSVEPLWLAHPHQSCSRGVQCLSVWRDARAGQCVLIILGLFASITFKWYIARRAVGEGSSISLIASRKRWHIIINLQYINAIFSHRNSPSSPPLPSPLPPPPPPPMLFCCSVPIAQGLAGCCVQS